MTQAWYPFYWSDYSGKTFNLSMSQHGAYMLLLRHVYTTGTSVPHNQRYSIARALLEQEKADVDFVLQIYFNNKSGSWVNDRAMEIIKETDERHEKRVSAGKIGGLSKSSNAKAKLKQKSTKALVTTTTTTTTNNKVKNDDDYYFSKCIIKLDEKDWQKWLKKFPNITDTDLEKILIDRGKWYEKNPAQQGARLVSEN